MALGLGLCASGLASPARAATTIVVQRGSDATATIYADGDRLRMDMPPKEGGPHGGPHAGPSAARDPMRPSAVIIDAKAKKIELVQDATKSYMELTEEDMKRVQARFTEAKARMEERMKNLPPEQRAKWEAMMGRANAKKDQKLEFQALGQKKTINGFACEMFKVVAGGVVNEEDCISPWSAGLVKQSDFAGLTKMKSEMFSDLGPSAGAIPLFDQYPGMPISRVPVGPDGKKGPESQVKSIKSGPLADALFTVPAGYTKKSLPMEGGAAPTSTTPAPAPTSAPTSTPAPGSGAKPLAPKP